MERARKVLDALGARLVVRVELEPMGVARKSPWCAARSRRALEFHAELQ